MPDVKRAEILAAVERARHAELLARRDEKMAEERCHELQLAVDVAHAAWSKAQGGETEDKFRRQLAEAERELEAEELALAAKRRRREDAQAALQGAERDRDIFVQDHELAKAPSQFEDAAGKAHAVLTGLAGAALAFGLRLSPTDARHRMGVYIALAGSALGLLAYLPQLVAAAIDSRRSRRAGPKVGSALVSWGRWIPLFRLIVLFALALAALFAWSLLMSSYLQPAAK